MLENRKIHLCVTGGIAAYKAVELARLLIKAGATVQVAMSENAQNFVGPLTFQAITQQPVLTRTMDPSEELEIGHIAFAQDADAMVVAPATANSIGKAALGLGDDLISTILLATNLPVVVAPAMNTVMYENPAVQRNLNTLKERGWNVVDPGSGELACGAIGAGRLAELEFIVQATRQAFTTPTLVGRHVLVTAGPTREYLDPVRFLSNPSTGRMGLAVAAAALDSGARVTLIHGPITEPVPDGVEAVSIISADEMYDAVVARCGDADAVFMAAAVADWKAPNIAPDKQKKGGESNQLNLVPTRDILAQLGRSREGSRPVLVGWAAETGDPTSAARDKLARKGVDLVVANDVSRPDAGFGVSTNVVSLVSSDAVEVLPVQSKRAIGEHLVRWLSKRLEETL